MVEKTKYEPGTFCWVELATKDGAAAKNFYASLFEWKVDDMPIPDGSVYSMLQKNGKQVGALYQLGPQQQGVPPHWNSYVSVASADASAAKAKELGGKVMVEPFDVLDAGFDGLQPRRRTPLEARELGRDIVGISGNLNCDRGKLEGQKETNCADNGDRQHDHQHRLNGSRLPGYHSLRNRDQSERSAAGDLEVNT